MGPQRTTVAPLSQAAPGAEGRGRSGGSAHRNEGRPPQPHSARGCVVSGAVLQKAVLSAPAPLGSSWSVVILKNRALGVLLFEALIIVVFSLASSRFFTLSNLNTIFLNACIMAILASAEGVVIITRNYDVSIASILALSSYVGFDVIRTFPEFGPLLILVPLGIGLA